MDQPKDPAREPQQADQTVTETVEEVRVAPDAGVSDEPVVPMGPFENQTVITPMEPPLEASITVEESAANAVPDGTFAGAAPTGYAPTPVNGAPATEGGVPANAAPNAAPANAAPNAPQQGAPNAAPQGAPRQSVPNVPPQGAPAQGAPQQPQRPVAPPPAAGKKASKTSLTVAGQEFDYGALITVIGAVIGVIGVFVPFITAKATIGGGLFSLSDSVTQTFSASLMDVEGALGWVIFVGVIAIAVLALLRQNVSALTVTILADILMVYTVAEEGAYYMGGHAKTSGSSSMASYSFSFSAGAWLIIISAIVLLIGTIISLYNERHAAGTAGAAAVRAGAPAAPANPYAAQQAAMAGNPIVNGNTGVPAGVSDYGFQYANGQFMNGPDGSPTVPPSPQGNQPGFQYANGQFMPDGYDNAQGVPAAQAAPAQDPQGASQGKPQQS